MQHIAHAKAARHSLNNRLLAIGVASAFGRRAVTRFGNFSVWTDAVLRVQAPVQAFVASGHAEIVLREDELTLPSE